MAQDFWTDDRVKALRKMWREGLSGTEIGERIGCTKSAAIGKAHRLELPRRKSPIGTLVGTRARWKNNKSDSKSSAYRLRRKILGNLGNGRNVNAMATMPADGGSPFATCQFLEGIPKKREFCGEPTYNFSSYCKEHYSVCYANKRA